jgi:hypothetical protein
MRGISGLLKSSEFSLSLLPNPLCPLPPLLCPHTLSYLLTPQTPTRLLHGNPSKAARILDWRPTVTFDALVKEMVECDLKVAASLVEDQN